MFSVPTVPSPARLKVQSGCMDEGVTDFRFVRELRYPPKALYSGGDSYVDQHFRERQATSGLTAEA